ncbi:MAG: FapA family protein [Brevinematales bacterium]|nr:FapA family protein [Brevinematales bacterium]
MDIKKIISLLDEIEEDTNTEELEIVAFTINEALKIASKELNTEIFNLEYEIIESGNSGFFGIGRKPYRIVVRKIGNLSFSNSSEHHSDEIMAIDGRFFVSHTTDGVYIKILPPKGNGRYVSYEEVVKEIEAKGILNYDSGKIKKEVQSPSGMPVLVSQPISTDPTEDSQPHIEVLPDESKSLLTLLKPGIRGKVPSPREILNLLKMEGVVHGIVMENIEKAVYEGIFDVPIEVAVWTPPEPGKDAKINYYIDINKSNSFQFNKNEKDIVDLHKVIKIENVVKGQVLASKEPATKGKPGITVKGKTIPAPDGKDISIQSLVGKNVEISPDGLELIAKEEGQVVFKQGKINVEPILEILKDISPETGDIDFVGNVIIRGSVRDTFKVKAGGNVDIWGTVEKAEVIADGNVIVRTGIQGKEVGRIVAGGDVISKFIERANIKAGGNVIALEYILHSNIVSKSRVFCFGRKASITGGTVKALYEISAKQLGAESWTDTVLEVGSDPELQEIYEDLSRRKEELSNKISELKKEVLIFQQMIQNFGRLPQEKEERYNTINTMLREYSIELENIEKEIKGIKEQLDQAVIEARVSAYGICYPNVKIKIKDALHICKDQYKFVTFKRENRTIIVVPYEESQDMREKKKEVTERVRKL